MSYLERQTTRITGTDHDHDSRRHSTTSKHSTSDVPHAKKPRSRPPRSFRDHIPFPNSSLPPTSGPYSVGSMDIEVPVENPRTISNITRDGKHLLQLETVLFTLYYPAAFGSGLGKAPGGGKKWSRETWIPRPRIETAKGYAKFAGLHDCVGIGLAGITTVSTKLRAYRNAPLARHWPPEGRSKKSGYKVKSNQGPPPEGVQREPNFPLLMFSHGLGGSRTAYSSLCCEFASYGFVVCAVEHRDGSGARTLVNHTKQNKKTIDGHEIASADRADSDIDIASEKERDRWKAFKRTEEEMNQGYHFVDYIFPKNNPKDTSPNNELGVDRDLRNAQIILRVCELEAAFHVLKTIWAGNGAQVARQNLRNGGTSGASSSGLEGVNWGHWRNRFDIDSMTMAGHSFGAATVVEVLRQADRFPSVRAGIIYDIWGAPIKPPAEDSRHRIHVPLLGINSEAFMYWQSNFDAVQSLMAEASEHGSPAYLITVRGSVHISQSDFSVLYRHLVSFFMKATVHPDRAIDLNISASLEFLRLVTASTSSGKAIIDRCVTDESILQTELLKEIPDDNRPDDEWIATRLQVNHELRRRIAAGLQRKFKRNFRGGMGTGYTTSNEVWSHFKPTNEQLERWIQEERKGETQVNKNTAIEGAGSHTTEDVTKSSESSGKDGKNLSSSDAEDEQAIDDSKGKMAVESNGTSSRTYHGNFSDALQDKEADVEERPGSTDKSMATDGGASSATPQDTWLGMLPALRDSPQQT